jgi:hypothetical protein
MVSVEKHYATVAIDRHNFSCKYFVGMRNLKVRVTVETPKSALCADKQDLDIQYDMSPII